MLQVFISHVEEDSQDAIQLARSLEAAGHRTWYFERDSAGVPGVSYIDLIIRALNASHVVIAVLSPPALRSVQVDRELLQAFQEGKSILTLLKGLTAQQLRDGQPRWAYMIGSHVQREVGAGGITSELGAILAGLGEIGAGVSAEPEAVPLSSPSSPPPSSGPGAVATHDIMSSGGALAAIAERISAEVRAGQLRSLEALERKAEELAVELRRRMVPFHHFLKIGPIYPLSVWPRDGENVARYIESYLRYARTSLTRLGPRLADLLDRPRLTVAMAEYSRAVFGGLEHVVRSSDTRLLLGRRRLAMKSGEADEALRRLTGMGCRQVSPLSFREWMEFLEHVAAGRERLDALLFGAEALTITGDVVFPQIVRDDELSLLREVRRAGVQVICVAEEFKVLPPEAEHDVHQLQRDEFFTIVPSTLVDHIVTDREVFLPSGGRYDLSPAYDRAIEAARIILDELLADEQLRPLRQCPAGALRDMRVMVADIDDTLTAHGRIPAEVLVRIERLAEAQVLVLLATGRPAGWAQALSAYLPGVYGVLSENGLALFREGGPPIELTPLCREIPRSALEHDADRLRSRFGLELSPDDGFRLYERSFLRPPMYSTEMRAEIEAQLAPGHAVASSSIHLHLRPSGWDKAKGIRAALAIGKVLASDSQVVVLGDSGNDAPMFDEFPTRSIGVANVLDDLPTLGQSLPRYVTARRGSEGFCELADRVLQIRGARRA